ncbi:RluA family pseudouridine synthase [Clostridium thermobutyricum]|jgi:23S rRNA pseudouridine1911/1915/1917 synthase|uniref:Pseudouridine synthase n=1 Tax=Clostridium thermobutyricum TaxID=29372 RepID=N9Y1C6_9CLOT|nr:RluA family pseudouridine synthase [Clostridium thermobutyricum]ENZ01959.1 RluA family pseudouridine synthase [Clostridium thermobutyricum]
MEEKIFEINEENKGIRIDKFITDIMEGKSRSYIQGMIEEGYVLVNNKKVKSNYKLKLNDVIKTTIKEPVELEVKKENIPIDILYEDSDVIVVNKPKGMVVHPAPGNYEGTLVNALLYHCKDLSSINGVIRPGIVHRIDKDTTGVLVVAKNDEAHVKLSEQLKDHSMKREYYALVEGRLKKDSGTIDKPLARSKRDRLKIAITEDGKRAVTHYSVIERFKNSTLVKCVLETGRTHQIRVHMSSIGYPLVGDPLYGFKKQKFKDDGQMLHAKVLGFIHPRTGEYMEFSSELPENYKKLLENLRKDCI